MEKYRIIKVEGRPYWRAVRDDVNGITIKFEIGHFNKTNEIVFDLEPTAEEYEKNGLRNVGEITDWLTKNHRNLVWQPPFSKDGDVITRNVYPRFELRLIEDVSDDKLAKILIGLSKFLKSEKYRKK